MHLKPRNTVFYDHFTAAAGTIAAAADTLAEFVVAAPTARPGLLARLGELEHRNDETTHAIMRLLNTSFVTPLDREDIATLAGRLDDVVDAIEEAAEFTTVAGVGDLPDGVRRQAALLVEAARLTVEAMPRLRSLADLESYWIAINDVENRADDVYRELLTTLFAEQTDPLAVIKAKVVIDHLEEAADAFEHVADVVQSVAAKES